MDPKDTLILSLCEKLYICSRTLTCVAERIDWNSTRVQELMLELEKEIERAKHVSGVAQVQQYCPDCGSILEIRVRPSDDIPR